jgi:hypothetical protein
MNKEIMKIVNKVLSEEMSDKMSDIKRRIFENKEMCEQCGTGQMVENECNECGYMKEAQLDELGGMDDGHPRFGKKRFSKEMSIDDIESILRGDSDMDTRTSLERERDMYDTDMEIGFKEIDEDEVEEGNEFSGELAKAREAGKKTFTVDGKTYPVKNESQLEEKWSNDVDVKKTGNHSNKSIEQLNTEIKKLKNKSEEFQKDGKKVPHKLRSDLSQLYFAKRAKKDDWSGKVAVSEQDVYELYMNESTGERIFFTENEVIDIIENIVLEEKNKKGSKTVDPTLKKSLKVSEKENEDYIESVVKKMKDYLKKGSKGSYEMNPKDFPRGNGEIEKMSKKAYIPSKSVDEYIKNFTAAALENIDYDGINPDEEWVTDNIEGSSRTGNNPDWANAVETGVNKERNTIRKNNLLSKLKKKAYNKASQPVNDVAGENADEASEILMKLESVENKKVLSEVQKMKDLIGYKQKTQ